MTKHPRKYQYMRTGKSSQHTANIALQLTKAILAIANLWDIILQQSLRKLISAHFWCIVHCGFIQDLPNCFSKVEKVM